MWRFILLAVLVVGIVEGRHTGRRRTTKREVDTCKVEDIDVVDVELSELEGIWYKVLHKFVGSDGKSSFTYYNELDGDKLNMTEYFIDPTGHCEGPVYGEWKKTSPGNFKIKITHETTWEMDAKLVYHYKHPRLESEELIALYACKKLEDDGTCGADNQVGAIMSKNRRPFAHSLFHAAKVLQTACIDPSSLERLNTLTHCGDELLDDEDQFDGTGTEYRAESAESAEGETEPMDKCAVENINGMPLDMDDMPEGTYFLIATHDGSLTEKGVTKMTIENTGEKEDGKLQTKFKTVEHGICYKGDSEEWVDSEDNTIWKFKANIRTPEGPTTIEKSMKIIYQKGDIFITYWCPSVNEETKRCERPDVGIWSTHPHVTVGELLVAYIKLKAVCVDSRHLVFMNTHALCLDYYDIATHEHEHEDIADSDKCKVSSIKAADHFNLEKLVGTWYVAGGIGTDSYHPGLKSVIMNRTKTDDPNVINTKAYINLMDGSCGEFTGTIKLEDAENAIVEHDVTGTLNGVEKKFNHKHKILHAGSQMIVFYWCPEELPNGKCKNPVMRIDSQTREIQHRDVKNILPHIEQTCIEPDSISWFFMHSQCGKEVDPPFSLRHGNLLFSHADTMDIITKFSTPQCQTTQIKGQDVCLKMIAEAGPWYSLAHYDSQFEDMKLYGSITRFVYAGNQAANLVEEVVMDWGDGKTCHDMHAQMYREDSSTKDDAKYFFKMSIAGQEHSEHFKWIWTNYKVGIVYNCRRPNRDGTCPTNQMGVYVMANQESIDHAEWLLIEQILKSLCIDPSLIHHCSTSEVCLVKSAERGNKAFLPAKSCDYDEVTRLPLTPDQLAGTYHLAAMASKTEFGNNYETVRAKIEKVDDNLIKYTAKKSKQGSEECIEREVIMTKTEKNEWTATFNQNGTDIKFAMFFAHVSGPYTVVMGCIGEDCNESTGFVAIYSKFRATDKIAIQGVYQFLQDSCIDPDWLQHLDTHGECGKDWDSRSCKMADIQGISEFDHENLDGIWHLTAHTNERYTNMKCKATAGDPDDNEVAVQCYAKMKERCFGPSDGKFTRDPEKPGKITFHFQSHGVTRTMEYTLVFADANNFLLLGCRKQNPDGSCLVSRTTLMLWSKQAKTTESDMSTGMKEKLNEVCVDLSHLKFMEESDCGKQLS